ncbi:MAG: hypothetical protein IT423_14495 [Pirellulaceae bacterium]|nr:hypothetical protein [Pirellulaceae bacterium]
MPKQYTGLGLTLFYPDSWAINEEASGENRPGMALETPGGSFMSIHLLSPEQDATDAIEEAAEAMNAEYEDVESETYEVDIAGQLCIGTIQRFYYLDFVITSKLLTVESENSVYLIQIQGEDRDMDQQSMVFDAILTSMVRSLAQPG